MSVLARSIADDFLFEFDCPQWSEMDDESKDLWTVVSNTCAASSTFGNPYASSEFAVDLYGSLLASDPIVLTTVGGITTISLSLTIGDGLIGTGSEADPLDWAGAATTGPITGSGTTLLPLDIATGSINATHLASTGVTAATYGNATNVPQVTIDQDGRVTAAVNVPITTGNGIYGGSGTIFANAVATVSTSFSIDHEGVNDIQLGDVSGAAGGDGIFIYPDSVQIGDVFGGAAYSFTVGSTIASITMQSPGGSISGIGTDIGIVKSAVAGSLYVDDQRAGAAAKGIEYTADLSANQLGNARSIPDVGTVKQVYTAGSGITITTVGNFREISSSGGATDLTFSGASSPVTLNSSTGTDVTITAGTGITLSATGSDLVINATGTGDILNGGNTTAATVIVGTNDANDFELETNNVIRLSITGAAATGGAFTFTNVTANTTTVQDVFTVRSNSTGTAGAGFGSGILFQLESSTTDNQDAARIAAAWTTATHASREAKLSFQLGDNGGAIAEVMRLDRTTVPTGGLAIGSATPVVIGFASMTTAAAYTVGNSAQTLIIGGSTGPTIVGNNTGTVEIASQSVAADGVKIRANGNVAGSNVLMGGLNWNYIAGTKNEFLFGSSYAPTSGTGIYNAITYNGAINQTGGANGITRLINLAPSLTSVADLRMIELNGSNANTKAIYQTGELTSSYFQGKMTIERQTAATGANNAFLNLNGGSITGDVDLLRGSANISSEMRAVFANARNTGNTGNVRMELQVGGVSAGDPYMLFSIPSGTNYVLGTDNSDADKFKLTPGGTTPGSTANKGIIVTADAVSLVGINKDSPLHPLHVEGIAMATLFVGKGDSWTDANIAFGTGAGTGPTITTIHGHGNGFSILFTTGTGPTANGIIFTATLPTQFPSGVSCIPTFSAYNRDESANDFLKFKISAQALNNFTFRAVGTLGASTTYGFNFHISGYDN